MSQAVQTNEFEMLAGRVDQAIAEVRNLDQEAQQKALALKSSIEEFHKVGLTRIVQRLKADPRGKELLFELAEDPSVYALFTLHGLIRNREAVAASPPAALIPLKSLTANSTPAWIAGPRLDDLSDGKLFRLDQGKASIVILRLGSDVQAFRNKCAHQGLPLDGGTVDREAGTITCPWHGFRYDARTGECLTAPQKPLEPLPVRIENGIVHVRPR